MVVHIVVKLRDPRGRVFVHSIALFVRRRTRHPEFGDPLECRQKRHCRGRLPFMRAGNSPCSDLRDGGIPSTEAFIIKCLMEFPENI